jgi:serine/threonine protein kinase
MLPLWNGFAGLEYLHAGCSPSFIHGNIKSSNILIAANRDAKVADYGLTKLKGEDGPSHVTTFADDSAGYLDPE